MNSLAPTDGRRDKLRTRTPMRCPICDGQLGNVIIRDIGGGLTAGTTWQIHAGQCPEHGWFQTEVISRPPREIFPVNKPFGAARRVIVDGREVFSFPTVWDRLPPEQQRAKVDPFDARYWQVDRSRREHEIY